MQYRYETKKVMFSKARKIQGTIISLSYHFKFQPTFDGLNFIIPPGVEVEISTDMDKITIAGKDYYFTDGGNFTSEKGVAVMHSLMLP